MRKKLFWSLLVVVFISFPIYGWSDCLSDFDCGLGYRCVKEPFKTRGVCMRPVDEFGIPKYDYSPRLDSIEPRYQGDCDFDLDCPLGFYCHRKYKVCVKR